MGLLVPDAGRFAEVEAGLDPAFFDDVLADLAPVKLTLALPRFTVRSEHDLVPAMQGLGMLAAFADADFSGMTTEAPLVIGGIYHQAFVDVDEEGTEAAAATVVVMPTGTVPDLETLTVDRPFLFWIRDVPTGAVLFLGRVTDPR
jgi:serpin B